MAKRENKSRYAVLGILSFGPRSGYDIKKAFEKNFSSFWSESYGQIYPILKRLVRQKLATRSVKRQSGKPDRYIYKITQKGHEVLKLWLTEPARRQVGRHEIVLKMIFGNQVSPDDNIRLIEEFRVNHQRELNELKAVKDQWNHLEMDDPALQYRLMAIRYGEYLNRAYIRWCNNCLKQLRKMENPDVFQKGMNTKD